MLVKRLVSLTAAASVAAAVWGIGIERHLYRIKHEALPILPEGAAPIRILHISDAHMAPWQGRKQAWIASLASLRPDFIINTGDTLGHADALPGVRAAFAGFAGTPGVYVHGSNDVYAPTPRNPLRYLTGPSKKPIKQLDQLDTAALDSYLTNTLGWSSVDNGAAHFVVNGTRLDIFGVGDAHHQSDQLERMSEFAAAAAEGEGDSDEPRIRLGVAHAPYQRVMNSFIDHNADAMFFGHTHGGQVRIPYYGALVSNCDLPPRQARGLSSWTHGDRTVPLHVSAGLGHSIYAPVRFSCPPEVTLLTLLPREP